VDDRSKRQVGTNRSTLRKVLTSSFFSTAISTVSALVILPRILGGVSLSRYGDWATLAAMLAIGQLAEGGVTTEISRRVATANGRGDMSAACQAVREGITVLSAIAAATEVVSLVAAHPVVNAVFSQASASQRGQLALLFIGVMTLFAVGLVGSGYFSILGGLQRSDYGSWSAVSAIVAGALTTVIGVSIGLGLWALFLADALQLVVGWVWPAFGVRRLVPELTFRFTHVSWATARSFIGRPAMLVVGSASVLFDSQIDKLVLTHTVGSDASAMFQIGTNIVLAAKSAALIPLGFLLAGTAELHATNPKRLRHLEFIANSTTQAVTSVIVGGFLIFSPVFLHVWLGPGYADAALSARFLAIAILINMWSASWYYYAAGLGRYSFIVAYSSVTLGVNAICTITLTTSIGLHGALIGSVAGSAAGTLTGWIILRRWERRNWLRPALRASLVVALIAVPFWAFLSSRIPPSWPGLVAWVLLYLVACGLILLVSRSIPIVFHRKRGGTLRLSWREDPAIYVPSE
jgi:O-antigen/teichoic acid export membrane protein